ncbi:MAG TPA: His/Gly/Thr/Pro-type tRNA ligase C-terminal domain-containing protein, partial [Gaiellales bacterium]|nr:His/Gly/Thr/Pro-type tRNA ligase C-terminal domain-containing protein [Gaiellales bacterium]
YDGLSEQLGGPPAPGVGFGSGIERVLELVGGGTAGGRSWVCFAVTEREARPRLFALMDELRVAGRVCQPVFGDRGLRRMLEAAARGGAATTVIVGSDEWARGAATVRDMHTHRQHDVPLDRLVEELS